MITQGRRWKEASRGGCVSPRVAVSNDHKQRGLKQEKFTFALIRRPEIKIKVSTGLFLSGSSKGESVPCLFPSCWGWPAGLEVPELLTASLQPLPPCPHGLHPCVSLMSLCLFSSYEATSHIRFRAQAYPV